MITTLFLLGALYLIRALLLDIDHEPIRLVVSQEWTLGRMYLSPFSSN